MPLFSVLWTLGFCVDTTEVDSDGTEGGEGVTEQSGERSGRWQGGDRGVTAKGGSDLDLH